MEVLGGLLGAVHKSFLVGLGLAVSEDASFGGVWWLNQFGSKGGLGSGIVPKDLVEEVFDADGDEVATRELPHVAEDVRAVETLTAVIEMELLDEGLGDGAEEIRAVVVAFAQKALAIFHGALADVCAVTRAMFNPNCTPASDLWASVAASPVH
jgi:hypothetical protein